MTHPNLSDDPHMWYAATLEYANGANVTAWAPVLNGASFADSASAYGTYDEDGMDGDPAVAFAAGAGAVSLMSGAFAATSEISVVWRCASGSISGGTHLFSICNSSGSPLISVGSVSYTLYVYDWSAYNYIAPQSYVTWPQDGTPFVLGLTFSASNSNRVRVYLNGTLVLDSTASSATRSFARIIVGPEASWTGEDAVWVENGSIVPRELSSTEMATLSDYIETPDSTYLGGGMTRYFTADGLLAGSHVVLTEIPHGQQWTADFAGISSIGGKYFDFSGHTGSAEVTYRAWFDVNNGNTAPSAGGRTLVEIDVATADDYIDWASAAATELSDLSGLTATASDGIMSVACSELVEIAAAADGTTGASITEVCSGGNLTALIAEIETTVGTAPIMQYIVARPRRLRFAATNPGEYCWLDGTTPCGIYGARVPVGAMQRTDYVYT